MDDKPHGEEPEEEGPWNPEDEKLERKYLRKVIEMMDRALQREREAESRRDEHAREIRTKMDQAVRSAARNLAGQVPSPHAPDGADPLIVVRPIENGFVVSFMEVVKADPAVPRSVPPEILQGLPPGATVVGAALSFKRVEAFVSEASAVVPYMERAMKSLRELERAEG